MRELLTCLLAILLMGGMFAASQMFFITGKWIHLYCFVSAALAFWRLLTW